MGVYANPGRGSPFTGKSDSSHSSKSTRMIAVVRKCLILVSCIAGLSLGGLGPSANDTTTHLIDSLRAILPTVSSHVSTGQSPTDRSSLPTAVYKAETFSDKYTVLTKEGDIPEQYKDKIKFVDKRMSVPLESGTPFEGYFVRKKKAIEFFIGIADLSKLSSTSDKVDKLKLEFPDAKRFMDIEMYYKEGQYVVDCKEGEKSLNLGGPKSTSREIKVNIPSDGNPELIISERKMPLDWSYSSLKSTSISAAEDVVPFKFSVIDSKASFSLIFAGGRIAVLKPEGASKASLIGGAVGGALGIALVICAAVAVWWFLKRRKQKKLKENEKEKEKPLPGKPADKKPEETATNDKDDDKKAKKGGKHDKKDKSAKKKSEKARKKDSDSVKSGADKDVSKGKDSGKEEDDDDKKKKKKKDLQEEDEKKTKDVEAKGKDGEKADADKKQTELKEQDQQRSKQKPKSSRKEVKEPAKKATEPAAATGAAKTGSKAELGREAAPPPTPETEGPKPAADKEKNVQKAASKAWDDLPDKVVPRIMPRNARAQAIARGELKQGEFDDPTMDDVADWKTNSYSVLPKRSGAPPDPGDKLYVPKQSAAAATDPVPAVAGEAVTAPKAGEKSKSLSLGALNEIIIDAADKLVRLKPSKPTDKPAEAPAEIPAETPAEVPAEKPGLKERAKNAFKKIVSFGKKKKKEETGQPE